MGLEQAPGGPQRTFLVLVLQQLVRLTAWDHPLLRQVGGGGRHRVWGMCRQTWCLCVL